MLDAFLRRYRYLYFRIHRWLEGRVDDPGAVPVAALAATMIPVMLFVGGLDFLEQGISGRREFGRRGGPALSGVTMLILCGLIWASWRYLVRGDRASRILDEFSRPGRDQAQDPKLSVVGIYVAALLFFALTARSIS